MFLCSLHFDCYLRFLRSTQDPYMDTNDISTQLEFDCPKCRRVGNTLIPIYEHEPFASSSVSSSSSSSSSPARPNRSPCTPSSSSMSSSSAGFSSTSVRPNRISPSLPSSSMASSSSALSPSVSSSSSSSDFESWLSSSMYRPSTSSGSSTARALSTHSSRFPSSSSSSSEPFATPPRIRGHNSRSRHVSGTSRTSHTEEVRKFVDAHLNKLPFPSKLFNAFLCDASAAHHRYVEPRGLEWRTSLITSFEHNIMLNEVANRDFSLSDLCAETAMRPKVQKRLQKCNKTRKRTAELGVFGVKARKRFSLSSPHKCLVSLQNSSDNSIVMQSTFVSDPTSTSSSMDMGSEYMPHAASQSTSTSSAASNTSRRHQTSDMSSHELKDSQSSSISPKEYPHVTSKVPQLNVLRTLFRCIADGFEHQRSITPWGKLLGDQAWDLGEYF